MPASGYFLRRKDLESLKRDGFYAGFHPAILHQPQPLLYKKGLRPLPQTPFPLQGRGLTAPPVALTLMYPRPIKGSG